MRRICWYVLALLLLFSLAGCSLGGDNQGQSQSSTSSTVLPQTRGDGSVIEPEQAIPDPTASASASAAASPTPTATTPGITPTAPSTARPTATAQTGGGSNAGTGPGKQLEQQLFALINQDRANAGLPAYALNSTLSAGALLHSKKMSSCGMSHQCAGEASPCDRISNEGIAWNVCGENVGYTSANPTDWEGVKQIEQHMLAEQPPDDGHRRNLLSSSFHRVGVGIYIDANGLVWVTEDFVN
jgi:uncharacterized protein YkwD